ncbi:hypothetical protein LMG26857_01784 [Achromobacter anxifer]|uniref:hypothetical protein n=1 Tax=Achromobacter anxifer TaxID=1287737 RepID=UPI00155C701E|nr:hypothetical protein [Achromobacter anxifer]CAB5512494.1 hypothetical protein LMG26857_01784 [Achromobacter anxifer]
MNSLDSLISNLLAAQAEENTHREAAAAAIAAMGTAGQPATAIAAMEAATQRVTQLGAQLLDLRGSSAPFIYAGQLYTFQGSRVSCIPVEAATLTGAPVQGGGEVSND